MASRESTTTGDRAPDGQLPRGPHSLTRRQVETNQRERIMTAMVDLVGEQGYGATSVTEVAKRAGVSRKAFYQQFANKQECFLATYDAVVAEGVDRVSAASRHAGGLQDELGLGLDALFQRSIETPSIQRLVLLEVAAVGPAGIERREQLISSYEGMLRESLGAAPRPGIIPNPLLRAVVGGVLRVLYTRVQTGAQRKLPALISELVRWSFTYYPLPATMDTIHELARPAPQFVLAAGRAPGTLSPWSTSSRRRAAHRRTPNVSRSFIVHSQRERILDALALLSVEKGYANIKVDEIARRASVSLEAFYEHFTDKQDAFLVAYEIGHSKSLALVEQAHDSAADWPRSVRAGITTLLEFLSSEPAFAHMALVDALIATPRTADRANKGILRYGQLLAPGFEEASSGVAPPELAVEAIAGGIFELCLAYTAQGHAQQLTELTPWVIYFALAPFIGIEEAARVASPDPIAPAA
jgi:AcrR family transcriptional regulator